MPAKLTPGQDMPTKIKEERWREFKDEGYSISTVPLNQGHRKLAFMTENGNTEFDEESYANDDHIIGKMYKHVLKIEKGEDES